MTRPPRWRCGDPDCPAHRWQPVLDHGEYDPVDAATGALEAHWARVHSDQAVKTGTVHRGRP